MASEYEIDFKAIKQAVSMERLLVDHYGIHLSGKDDELRGACPLPGCGSTRGLTVNVVKGTGGVWKCHKCRKGGSQLDLVIAMGHAGSTKEAAIYIKQEIIYKAKVGELVPVSATEGKEQLGAVQEPAPQTSLELLESHIERLQSEIAEQEEQLEWDKAQLKFLERYRSVCLEIELRFK